MIIDIIPNLQYRPIQTFPKEKKTLAVRIPFKDRSKSWMNRRILAPPPPRITGYLSAFVAPFALEENWPPRLMSVRSWRGRKLDQLTSLLADRVVANAVEFRGEQRIGTRTRERRAFFSLSLSPRCFPVPYNDVPYSSHFFSTPPLHSPGDGRRVACTRNGWRIRGRSSMESRDLAVSRLLIGKGRGG